jgi:hypothetical protein
MKLGGNITKLCLPRECIRGLEGKYDTSRGRRGVEVHISSNSIITYPDILSSYKIF